MGTVRAQRRGRLRQGRWFGPRSITHRGCSCCTQGNAVPRLLRWSQNSGRDRIAQPPRCRADARRACTVTYHHHPPRSAQPSPPNSQTTDRPRTYDTRSSGATAHMDRHEERRRRRPRCVDLAKPCDMSSRSLRPLASARHHTPFVNFFVDSAIGSGVKYKASTNHKRFVLLKLWPDALLLQLFAHRPLRSRGAPTPGLGVANPIIVSSYMFRLLYANCSNFRRPLVEHERTLGPGIASRLSRTAGAATNSVLR